MLARVSAIAAAFLWAGAAVAFPVERCINLSNYLEVPKGDNWAYDHRPEHIDAIAEAGFDTLRLPINAGDFWDGRALEPDFSAKVQSVVDRAKAAGLYVIIDLHHYDAFVDDPVGKADEFLAIWSALAELFAGQDGLAFELLNEPTDAHETSAYLPLFDQAREIIRAKHPEAWIIYGGAYWNRLTEMLNLPASSDPYVVHTFHYYVPFKFTHQQLPWVDDPFPPRSWGSDEERNLVTQNFARAAGHHTPVFLGEFGAIDTAPAKDRVAWLRHVRVEAEKAGVPWCHWGFGARFGVFDPASDTWNADVLKALME